MIVKPEFAKKKINFKDMHSTESALTGLGLNTVCHHARCPNISECYGRGTATFLILGDTCTRDCSFCNVKKGRPSNIDENEPYRISEAVEKLKIKYVVITSVTRDDLPDGGASVFAETVRVLKEKNPNIKIEVLTPDFKGNPESLDTIIASGPFVFAHNVETVPSRYIHVRKSSSYERSLGVLSYAKHKAPSLLTKSGIMLGIGETEPEVLSVFSDLRGACCDFLSIGQYLQPDKFHYPVQEYITPEKFEYYKTKALEAGFGHTESGVWVRSSYMAEKYSKE